MLEKYEAYHGTSEDAGTAILAEQHFLSSRQDKEWAGSGVYFFIGLEPDKNALKWAKYIQRFENPTVLKATILCDPDRIFDLTLLDHQQLFHRFREHMFIEAKNRAAKYGKELDDTMTNRRKMDCAAFNRICAQEGFHAVKRQCYIHFKSRNDWSRYPNSDIPNCTIFCVREEGIIQNIERIVN